MSIPSTLIAGFIGLASCGAMGSRIVNSLWLIAVDPHRGGSLLLQPLHWGTLQWVLIPHHLFEPEDVILMGGDDVVVRKTGKHAYGLDRVFFSLYCEVAP